MKIKVSKLLICSLILALGLSTLLVRAEENNKTAVSNIQINNATVDYGFGIGSVEQIEELSDVIIKGKVLPNSTNFIIPDNFNGFTITNVEVAEVFSGDVSVGDVVEIIEDYYYTEHNNIIYLNIFDGYLPSETDREYIFFLTKHPENHGYRAGKYGMYNVKMGRYPVSNNETKMTTQSVSQNVKSMLNDQLDLLPETNTTDYRSVYEQVLEKYDSN